MRGMRAIKRQKANSTPKATKPRSRLARGSHRSPPTRTSHAHAPTRAPAPPFGAARELVPKCQERPVRCALRAHEARRSPSSPVHLFSGVPSSSSCITCSAASKQVSRTPRPCAGFGGPASRYCGAVYGVVECVSVRLHYLLTYLLGSRCGRRSADAERLPLKRACRVRGAGVAVTVRLGLERG